MTLIIRHFLGPNCHIIEVINVCSGGTDTMIALELTHAVANAFHFGYKFNNFGVDDHVYIQTTCTQFSKH
jgi:hypothetical protein